MSAKTRGHSLVPYLQQLRGFYRVIIVAGTVGVPTIIGILQDAITDWSKPFENPLVYALGFAILVQLAIVISALRIEAPAPDVYSSLESFREKNKELHSLSKQLEAQRNLFQSAAEATELNLASIEEIRTRNAPNSSDKFSRDEVIELILEPWMSGKYQIWSYQGDALWNFVLYWVQGGDPDAEHMAVIWRDNDRRIEPLNREWQRGDGHIGRCWTRGATQISPPEFAESNLRQICAEQRECDNKYYHSVLTTPVTIDGVVRGVFVVTSNIDGQFNDAEHSQPAALVGTALAQGLSFCKADADLFIKRARGRNGRK